MLNPLLQEPNMRMKLSKSKVTSENNSLTARRILFAKLNSSKVKAVDLVTSSMLRTNMRSTVMNAILSVHQTCLTSIKVSADA